MARSKLSDAPKSSQCMRKSTSYSTILKKKQTGAHQYFLNGSNKIDTAYNDDSNDYFAYDQNNAFYKGL